jgi:heat shock protein HslJ
MKTFVRFASFFLTMLSFILVGESGPASNAPPDHALYGVTWVAEQIAGKPVTENPPELTLDRAKSIVSGSTGVNRLHGQYSLNGNAIEFGPIATTRRAGTEEAMKMETRFLRKLEQVNGWHVADDHLELLKDGMIIMKFARKP